MKIFKKLIVLTLALLLSACCLTAIACKDGGNPAPSVSGKYYKTASLTTGGITYNIGDNIGSEVLQEDFILVSFAEDGTCTYIIYGITGPCTWVQNGYTVTVIPTGEPESEYINFTVTSTGLSVIDPTFTVNLVEYTPAQ